MIFIAICFAVFMVATALNWQEELDKDCQALGYDYSLRMGYCEKVEGDYVYRVRVSNGKILKEVGG